MLTRASCNRLVQSTSCVTSERQNVAVCTGWTSAQLSGTLHMRHLREPACVVIRTACTEVYNGRQSMHVRISQ
jgi:hypothetical protein